LCLPIVLRAESPQHGWETGAFGGVG